MVATPCLTRRKGAAAALDQIGERFGPDEYTLVELLTRPPVVPTGMPAG
ncbi:hypothetical protein AB0I77_27515 [Streptomyces sp. NPDC050619]